MAAALCAKIANIFQSDIINIVSQMYGLSLTSFCIDSTCVEAACMAWGNAPVLCAAVLCAAFCSGSITFEGWVYFASIVGGLYAGCERNNLLFWA